MPPSKAEARSPAAEGEPAALVFRLLAVVEAGRRGAGMLESVLRSSAPAEGLLVERMTPPLCSVLLTVVLFTAGRGTGGGESAPKLGEAGDMATPCSAEALSPMAPRRAEGVRLAGAAATGVGAAAAAGAATKGSARVGKATRPAEPAPLAATAGARAAEPLPLPLVLPPRLPRRGRSAGALAAPRLSCSASLKEGRAAAAAIPPRLGSAEAAAARRRGGRRRGLLRQPAVPRLLRRQRRASPP